MSDLASERAGRRRAWLDEVRATLALAVADHRHQSAADRADHDRRHHDGPARTAMRSPPASLGANLFFAFVIVGIGLVTAVAPMVARELGGSRHSVRDVRRTLRQGLWSAIADLAPDLGDPLVRRADPALRSARSRSVAAGAASYMLTLQWAYLPFLGYIVDALFHRRRGASALGHLGRRNRLRRQRRSRLVPDLRPARLSAARADRRRHRHDLLHRRRCSLAWSVVVYARSEIPPLPSASVASGAPTGRASASSGRLGLPIAATLVFEVSIFNAAVFLMGLIGTTALAAHSIAIQIASRHLHGAARLRPGGDGARRPRLRRRRPEGDPPRRLDRLCRSASASWRSPPALMLLRAAASDRRLPRPRRSRQAAGGRARRDASSPSPRSSSSSTERRSVGAGMLRGLHDTRVPMLFAALGYWGIGLPLGVAARLPARARRRGHLDRACHRTCRRSRR